jgi:glucan 1,3-beta-glucosidase
MNNSMASFGLSIAGEFSAAPNDCGLWIHGVDLGSVFDGTYAGSVSVGNCTFWNDWESWDDDMKSGIKQFVLTSMDALQNYFYWTWKIGNSSLSGKVEAPFWSYQLGLAKG